jgi:hypothetical protein
MKMIICDCGNVVIFLDGKQYEICNKCNKVHILS